jgi:hypothetical protein
MPTALTSKGAEMNRVLTALLCAVLFASCAAPPVINNSPGYNPGYSSNAEWMAANGIVPTESIPPIPMTPLTQDSNAPRMNAAEIAHANALIQHRTTPTTPPPQPGVSGWDILGAVILFPLLLPVAMIANYPGPGVHCYSYTYKDQYHVKC